MAEPTVTREKFLFTVPQAAESLGVGTRMIWFAIRRKELKTTRIGRRTLIHRDALARFSLKDHAGARG